jgi:puromycin-sensitive aminopeptidase
VLPADARREHQTRVGALIGPALGRLGWEPREGEPDLDRELRGLLVGAAVALAGDADATARCRQLFAELRAGREVEPNLAGAVLRAVAAVATPADLEELLTGFREGRTPQEEQRYLFATAEVRDPILFGRVLEVATSTEVRTQNAPYLLAVCIANRDNGTTAWALVRDRWDELVERFPSNSIARMLAGVRSLWDPAVTADVEAFLDAHPLPQGAQTIAQHRERMQVTERLARSVRPG